MQTEIVLSLDNEVLQKVQRWAQSQQMPINDAIACLLAQLPDPDCSPMLSPWTQSLVGVLKVKNDVNEDLLQKQYLDYLEEKYQ